MTTPTDFTGCNVLVIGATTGIGRATAIAFAEAGANVAIGGLGEADGRAVEAEIKKRGRDSLFLETDVRHEAQIEKLIAATTARWKRIHVAINNAGTEGRFAPLQDMTVADFDNIIAVNLRGIFLGLRHEIPHMRANGGGAIVNMSSNAGLKAIANIAIYTASKHGVAGLTKAAALENARHNIRINAVAPGAVETGLLHRMVDGHVPTEAIAESTPMGRISQPEEIARTILFLASDSASYMTGVIVPVDGGGIAG
jgi:NAD(P)-dependent dehydrogenase (short-subunit alcohol dehydrogenase family)